MTMASLLIANRGEIAIRVARPNFVDGYRVAEIEQGVLIGRR